MQAFRNSTFVKLLMAIGFSALAFGCAVESTGEFRNALTGEACVPDETYVARDTSNGNGNTSPTGIPGDNLDDLRSGQIDCLYDGDSGQGNDARKCEFPPGCDSQGCCDDDMFPEEPEIEPTPEDPTTEPTPEDPTTEPTPEPTPEPAPEEPTPTPVPDPIVL